MLHNHSLFQKSPVHKRHNPTLYRLIIRVLLGVFLVGIVSAAVIRPARAQTRAPANCPIATPWPLIIGQAALVTPGTATNLRQTPGKTAGLVTQIAGDTLITVLAGPDCADNLRWWQVTDGHSTGWMAEGSGQTAYIILVAGDPKTVFIYDGTFPNLPIAFRNVRMIYNGVFGKSIALDINDITIPNDASESPLFGSRYIGLNFPSYGSSGFNPTLFIFPVADVNLAEGVGSTPAPDSMERPTATTQCPPKNSDANRMPTANGAMTILRAKPLTFRFNKSAGSAIRQVTAAHQADAPVLTGALRYIVQGLTDNGCYYMYGEFPITADFLPSRNDPDFDAVASAAGSVSGNEMQKRFEAYYNSVQAKVAAAASSGFTPRLEVMDAFFKSIIVD